MNFSDTKNGYGLVSRFNHWAGALVIFALLGIGLYFHEMPRGDERVYWLRLHVALGALTFLFLAFRVIWRAMGRSPDASAPSAARQKVTRWAHALLLFGIATMLVTGPVIVWTADRPISIFEWLVIPSPFGKMELLHEALEGVHAVVSRVLLVLIVIHVLAALKHALLDRDGTMRRMTGAAR